LGEVSEAREQAATGFAIGEKIRDREICLFG
jgi:hypothetical protein